MLEPAPADFWQRVAQLVARAVIERETTLTPLATVREQFGVKLPHLATLTAKPPPPDTAA